MTNIEQRDRDYLKAKQLAQVLLNDINEPNPADIKGAVSMASSMVSAKNGGSVDEERLVRDLESLYSTWIGIGAILENDCEHIDWLDGKKATVEWDFWNRYCRYLELNKGRSPKVLAALDEITDSILERLEDPQRPGKWSRRGMVVGHVQSGKTANYTGLICKAADAGYNLIIVLAGLHNSLRSQTQRRLDEEFLGFDSRVYRAFDENKSSRICAGLIPTRQYLIANSATSSEQNGDFKKTVARQYNLVPGGKHPTLLVVKKNKSVLTNLIKWATAHRSVKDESGQRIVRDVPLLVIDDEADQASVNTEPIPFDDNGAMDNEHSPTAINGLIRKLLSSFEQNAYVGYTATPFANIFIHPDALATGFGDDLFPDSFIVSLPTPSNYVGPAEIFGLNASLDENSLLSAKMIKIIEDQDKWFPVESAKDKDFEPGELPPSLKEAIRSFIIVCAIRASRGQGGQHNSMLVHVTRFKNVQQRVSETIASELRDLKNRIRYEKVGVEGSIFEEFYTLWKTEFSEQGGDEWRSIEAHLVDAAVKIKVKTINGESNDVLEYSDSAKPVSVIAVGGNKLSRGLTLDGLSVSYYLRASRMYDTLMQMGRWFGYRPGYLDLCRLYTTEELINWYRHIAVATEELRAEFDEMASRRATPRDFGLRVRSHPAGLDITAVNKMRSGTLMELSYDGTTRLSPV